MEFKEKSAEFFASRVFKVRASGRQQEWIYAEQFELNIFTIYIYVYLIGVSHQNLCVLTIVSIIDLDAVPPCSF